jgi:hypothetical protein
MPPETLLRIPFSVIGRCSSVPTPHWLHGKCVKFIGRRLRVAEIFFEISNPRGQSKTLTLFFQQQGNKHV